MTPVRVRPSVFRRRGFRSPFALRIGGPHVLLGRLVLLGQLVSIGVLWSGGCRVPPPTSRDDLSRDWSRQESVAVRAAEQLAARRGSRAPGTRASLSRTQGPFGSGLRGRDSPGPGVVSEAEHCDTFLGPSDPSDLAEMDAVVEEVLRVNSNLEAAEASWKAAMELYPQAASWDDPNFRFQNGPTLFGAAQGAHLWRLQFAQEIPWFGKTGLRGELADRTADVAHYEWRHTRQKLVSLARRSYIEYAMSQRLRELQQDDYRLAKAALEPPPTVAQAGWDLEALERREAYELEVLELEEQQAEVRDTHRRSRSQLNRLLHRDADAPLPDPRLPESPRSLPDAETLVQKAYSMSPELAIARQRERQAEASRQLAEREFYPDVKLVARFDTNASDFWAPDRVSLKPQLGVYLNPPIQQRRRRARLRETELTQKRRRAEMRTVETSIRDAIETKIAEMERSTERLASLDRLIAAARRRADTRATLVAARDGGRSGEHLTAKRAVIKYQIAKLREEAELMLQFNELASITGEDGWSGEDPANVVGAWRSSIQFLPAPANDWMDSIRSIGDDDVMP